MEGLCCKVWINLMQSLLQAFPALEITKRCSVHSLKLSTAELIYDILDYNWWDKDQDISYVGWKLFSCIWKQTVYAYLAF